MILAAGRGERLRPVSDDVPKALMEVAGVTLIERHLTMLSGCGISTVVVNLGWLGEQIVERVGSGRRFGLHVIYSPEYGGVLETGGGIRRALPVLGDEPFWVINADVLTDWQLDDAGIDDDQPGHLVLVPTPPHKANGDFDLDNGLVCNANSPRYTFSGIARYSPEFFDDTPEGPFSVAPMLRDAADRGRLSGSLYQGRWWDIGSPDRLAEANRQYTT
jgi:MurNAc alpha-1-phosphate uridylyltransferase